MTKCETRKQLSYSRLGTGISQEDGGSNLPLACLSLIVPSYWQMRGVGWGWGCMGIKRDKSGKSSSQIVPRIWNSRLSCMICEKANLWRIQTKNVIKSDEKWTLNIPIYENPPHIPLFSICPLQKLYNS
jgi:hypothetical protein